MGKKPIWKKYSIGEMIKIGLLQGIIGMFIYLPFVWFMALLGTILSQHWIISLFALLGATIIFSFFQFAWIECLRNSLTKQANKEIYVIDKKRRNPIMLKL